MNVFQADGYMILAMKKAGLNADQVTAVRRELWDIFQSTHEYDVADQGRQAYEEFLDNN